MGGAVPLSSLAGALLNEGEAVAPSVARATGMGFRPNMPLLFGSAPEGEKIAQAAINVNGNIFAGPSHFDAVQQAEKSLGMPFEAMQHGPILDGFVTDSGRFVSRYEAGHVAGAPQQGCAWVAFR
jgi:hypothetical protein